MADVDKPIDGELVDSIAMLEQILEVMPQDADTLRALYSMYRQCDRRDQAFEYLEMLAQVACSANDAELIDFVAEQLQSFAEEHPEKVSDHLERIQTKAPAVEPSGASKASGQSSNVGNADISEELALAWKLYEEDQLSQEEYSSVLHDLTETSSKELDVPVSVLHVLNDRGFSQMNRILNHISSRSGIPCLSLINFELPEQMADILPLDIPAHDGALPFGMFGDDLLVAVLNPFDNALLEKVEQASGHRCHTFIVPPEEYDAALDKLRGMAA
jgi:tetratricopeptide (TPR) repeat protein